MRRHLFLVLPLLSYACSNLSSRAVEQSYSGSWPTSDLALGFLEAEDSASFECRLDGVVVEAAEAARRLRDLPPGASARLSLTRGDAVVDMIVSGDSSITASSLCSWTSEVRSRWGWK